MILLIDGYNFLKNVYSIQISDSIKSEFINKLSAYSRRKHHKIVVVFDGGPFSFPTKETIKEIEVVYSGYKKSADEVIKDYLHEASNREILLISSDRDLQKFANSLNIDFISVKEFYNIFVYQKNSTADSTKGDNTLYKITTRETPELDELMLEEIDRVFKKDADYKIEDKHISAADKVSKKEKRLISKLKKL